MNSFLDYFSGSDMKAFTTKFYHEERKSVESHYTRTPERYATGIVDHFNNSRLLSEANEDVSEAQYDSSATLSEADNFGFGLVHAVAHGYSSNSGNGRKNAQDSNRAHSWNESYLSHQMENYQNDSNNYEQQNCTFFRESSLSCQNLSQNQGIRSQAVLRQEGRPVTANAFEWMKIKRNNQKTSKCFKLTLRLNWLTYSMKVVLTLSTFICRQSTRVWAGEHRSNRTNQFYN